MPRGAGPSGIGRSQAGWLPSEEETVNRLSLLAFALSFFSMFAGLTRAIYAQAVDTCSGVTHVIVTPSGQVLSYLTCHGGCARSGGSCHAEPIATAGMTCMCDDRLAIYRGCLMVEGQGTTGQGVFFCVTVTCPVPCEEFEIGFLKLPSGTVLAEVICVCP